MTILTRSVFVRIVITSFLPINYRKAWSSEYNMPWQKWKFQIGSYSFDWKEDFNAESDSDPHSVI